MGIPISRSHQVKLKFIPFLFLSCQDFTKKSTVLKHESDHVCLRGNVAAASQCNAMPEQTHHKKRRSRMLQRDYFTRRASNWTTGLKDMLQGRLRHLQARRRSSSVVFRLRNWCEASHFRTTGRLDSWAQHLHYRYGNQILRLRQQKPLQQFLCKARQNHML